MNAEREPMLVSELLAQLGVAHHPIADQVLSVLEWLQTHEPNGFLWLGIDAWLRDPHGRLELWRGGLV